MISWELTRIIALTSVIVGTVKGSTHFIFMTSYCSRSLEVNSSLSMALTSESLLAKDRSDLDFVHCALDLSSPPGTRLFVHFMQLSVSPVRKDVDRVHLYDMKPTKRSLTPPAGLYGKLERQLFLYDDSGVFVEDYKTKSRKLRIDYLGKPTITNSGFRLLVTAVQDPSSSGNCPGRWFRCNHKDMCVPPETSCDGLSNCGANDITDETGCERDDRVTDLLQNYSLARDIVVVVFLPLVIFITCVVAACLCYRRQIRKKFPKPEAPPVLYSPAKDGRVEILRTSQDLTRLYAPPSYEDLFNPRTLEPPPAYTSLASLVESGKIVVEEKTDSRRQSPRRGPHNSLRIPRQDKYDSGSNSSLEDDQKRVTQYERYRQYCHSDSDNDDEETRRRRRRKGGGAKAKGRRRTEGVPLDIHPLPLRTNNMSSCPHGPSPLASPSSASGHSVPYNYSSTASFSQSPSSSSSPEQKASAIPISPASGKSSESSSSKIKADDCIPIHPDLETRPTSQNSKTESLKWESSGTEADRKSDSEMSRPTSKRNSKTESHASSAENVKENDVESGVTEEDIDVTKSQTRSDMQKFKNWC